MPHVLRWDCCAGFHCRTHNAVALKLCESVHARISQNPQNLMSAHVRRFYLCACVGVAWLVGLAGANDNDYRMADTAYDEFCSRAGTQQLWRERDLQKRAQQTSKVLPDRVIIQTERAPHADSWRRLCKWLRTTRTPCFNIIDNWLSIHARMFCDVFVYILLRTLYILRSYSSCT